MSDELLIVPVKMVARREIIEGEKPAASLSFEIGQLRRIYSDYLFDRGGATQTCAFGVSLEEAAFFNTGNEYEIVVRRKNGSIQQK